MGAETSVVVALFFMGFLVVSAFTYSWVNSNQNLVNNAQNVHDTMKNAKLQTDITITNVSSSNNCLTITLKNTGETTLNASLLNIIVNGIYYSSSYCMSTGSTWVPKSSKSIVFCSARTITVDNSTYAIGQSVSSMTWQHTVGSGLSNSLLVVGVDITKDNSPQVTSITYAGVSLTRATFSVSAQGVRAELWYLINPPAGANNIVVNFSPALDNQGAIAGAVSFSGVDQTNPIPTTTTKNGSGSNPINSITTANANATIIDTLVWNAAATLTPVSPQIPRWSTISGGGITGAGSTKTTTTAGSQTMSWTTGGSADWAWAAAEINPSGCNMPTNGRIKVVTENGIWDYAIAS